MKPRTATELAILCAAGLIALALVIAGLHVTHANSKAVVWVVVFPVIGVGVLAWFRAGPAARQPPPGPGHF